MNPLKVMIVANTLENKCRFDIFDELAIYHDITICTSDNSSKISSQFSHLKVKYFSNIEDMPGYLRGVERVLENADVIVVMDSNYLPAFQAIRFGDKLQIPIILMMFHLQPSLKSEAIGGITERSFGGRCYFLVSSTELEKTLISNGVAPSKIQVIKPAIHEFFFHADIMRKEVRDLADIDENDKVILFLDPLTQWYQPEKLVQILRQIKDKNKDIRSKFKIFFYSDGDLVDDIKYLAADLGLCHEIRIISDCSIFPRWKILLASDFLVSFKEPSLEKCPSIYDWIQVMVCGVISLFPKSNVVCHPLIEESIVRFTSESDLKNILSRFVSNEKYFKRVAKHHNRILSKFKNIRERAIEYEIFFRRIILESKRFSHRIKSDEILDAVEVNLKNKNYSSGIAYIENLLADCIDRPMRKSNLLTLKGELENRAGNYQVASEAFSESVYINAQNWRSYLNLGWLSYVAHCNEEALIHFRRALGVKVVCHDAFLGIGLIHRRLGIFEDAIFWLYKSLQGNFENSTCLLALTQTCLEAKNIDIPIFYLEKAMELLGERPALIMALGQLYLEQGKFTLGNQMISRAMGLVGEK